jgi:hypothetical protein
MEAIVQSVVKFDKLLSESEFNRFGLIAVILTIVGCLGGVAIGLGAIESTFTLILVTIPTMLTLSLLLAVAPMKWILSVATVAVAIDVLLILFYTFLA